MASAEAAVFSLVPLVFRLGLAVFGLGLAGFLGFYSALAFFTRTHLLPENFYRPSPALRAAATPLYPAWQTSKQANQKQAAQSFDSCPMFTHEAHCGNIPKRFLRTKPWHSHAHPARHSQV